MSRPKFNDAQNFLVGCGTGDELNNGLVNDPIPRDHYSAQLEEHGANTFPLPAPAHFQPVNTQINHNQSVQPDAYLHQFGTATSYAMEHGLVNVQLPHRWDQPQGAFYTVNPSISAQTNLPPLAKPGSSQSSNISNADLEKRLRKQESDRKSRAKKEKMRRENEERLGKVTEENNELKDGEVKMKRTLKNFEQKVSHLEKEVGRLTNELKSQNTKVDVLSEKLVASSETTVLVEENKQLKRKNEKLMTRLNNPDIMQKVELDEENEKLKREVKRLRIINDALCDKMNNDEH